MNMHTWLVYSLMATLCWGLWSFLAKISSLSLNSRTVLILACAGSFIAFPLLVTLFNKHLWFSWKNLNCYIAILSGVIGLLGSLFFYLALAQTEATRVVVISALYPAVTTILAIIFLNENMTISKISGVIMAIAGIILLSL